MGLEELWKSVLGEVELEVSKPNFVTWLKNSRLIDKKDGVAFVNLPNSFAKAWVENKYNKNILRSLRNIDQDVKRVAYGVSRGDDERPVVAKAAPQFIQQLSFQEFRVDPETNLNPRYTLNSFIVGSSNELAFAAVNAVIHSIATKYNPLFIYGGSGLGKTHLIQAAGNEIKSLYKNRVRVRYVPSEKYVSDVVLAIRNKRVEDIKEKYRSVDVLIIDDVQFIGGKEKTEEEFFHTFNALYDNNKQIIISSDRPPRAIPTLEERLRSRLQSGMVADIYPPDYETRVAIIKTKLQSRNQELGEDIIDAIASKVQKNIREVEGVLNRILFYEQHKEERMTLKTAETIIQEATTHPLKQISVQQVIEAVAAFFEMPEKDLIGRSRKKEIALPRQIAMYLIREELNASYPEIGSKLGKRDHTTAIYAYEKIAKEVTKNQVLANKINLIRDKINGS
jgi:chromosomal replication initiator protein